jgi:hypothetical protein
MKMFAGWPVRPGPGQLDALLSVLDSLGELTLQQVVLRDELRKLLSTDEAREAIWKRLWRV